LKLGTRLPNLEYRTLQSDFILYFRTVQVSVAFQPYRLHESFEVFTAM